MMMKPIQINKYQIYLIGGTNENVSQAYPEWLCYDLKTKHITVEPSMNRGRMSFGIIYFNYYIYVVGGAGNNRSLLPNCERFDVYGKLKNPDYKWEELPSLKETRFSSSLIILKHRYLYCLASSVLSQIDDDDSDSDDDDLEDDEDEDALEKKLQKKVASAKDKIINNAGRYMSKRKVEELEDKLYKEFKNKMEEEIKEREERKQDKEQRRLEREKRRDKLKMLRKSTSGVMYFNLIERIDLENPVEWEYVDIIHWDLKNHSQLGMIEISHSTIIVFGGASNENEQSNIKNSYEINLEDQSIIKTETKILAWDKFYYGQTSVIGEKVYLLGKKHIHIYNIIEKRFKAIPNRGYDCLSQLNL